MQICTSISIEKSLCKFAESSDRVTDLSYTYPLADDMVMKSGGALAL